MIRNEKPLLPAVPRVMLLVGVALATLAPSATRGQDVPERTPIRVACLDVYGQAEQGTGPKNLLRCLSSSPDFSFKTVTADEIRAHALEDFDVLICPGGSGSRQSRTLGAEGRRAVEEFVKSGGGYIGICAGAYLASSHYTWSLGILNAQVLDTEHWARGTGDVTLEMTAEGRRLLGTDDEIVTCYYGQGPLLAPGDRADLPAYQTLAAYHSEIAKKGAPSGVMVGTTAIAAAPFGKGRVLCFSPHPEKTRGLEDFIQRASRWAAGRDRQAQEAVAEGTGSSGGEKDRQARLSEPTL